LKNQKRLLEINKEELFETPAFDKLWNYSGPAETEKKFRDILPEIKSTKDVSAYLQLLTQIARTLGLQKKFDEADNILDEAEPQLSEEQYIAKIRYELERGRILNSSRKKDKGKEHFLKAYELALKHKLDFYSIDAAHMLGIIETAEDSLKWNETAMKIAEESDNARARKWLGSLYNNNGWTYHDMKNYDKAMELFEKNVEWHTENNKVKEMIIAKWCVARTLRSMNKIDEALKSQQDVLEEALQKGITDNGYTYEELGECFLLKGNKEEAAKNFRVAYDELSQDTWLAEYEKERLERIKELSEVN